MLDGKVAVITGAARGLGRACATTFAENGAALVLLDIGHDLDEVPYPLGSGDQLAHTAKLCEVRGAPIACIEADVRDSTQRSGSIINICR